jgi:hypothetical protein
MPETKGNKRSISWGMAYDDGSDPGSVESLRQSIATLAKSNGARHQRALILLEELQRLQDEHRALMRQLLAQLQG